MLRKVCEVYRRIAFVAFTSVIISLLLSLGGQASALEPSSEPTSALVECEPGWGIVPAANTASTSNRLLDVEALAANNIWAVGHYIDGSIEKTLVEHWDGTQWSIVTSPNVGSDHNYLNAIYATSAEDIWAVGYYYESVVQLLTRTLIMHWNGSTWSVVPSPNTSSQGNTLTDVESISGSQALAVGYSRSYVGYDTYAPILLLWDGMQWATQSVPNTGQYGSRFFSLDVVSANDIWAVGSTCVTFACVHTNTFTTHWNGTTWAIVPSPNVAGVNNDLQAVWGASPSNVWAVGSADGHTMTLRWNSTAWEVVPSPNTGDNTLLYDVAGLSPTEVWAVGTYRIQQASGYAPVVMLWDGTAWSIVPSANPNPTAWSMSELRGVDVVAAYDAWAVGYANTNTLVEHRGIFSDVQPASAFYPYVTCLVNRGIISGYSDCTFRPNNPVTRGQLSKIVSNSAGFNDPPGSQMFQDVPPGSPFYEWVQRLASRGYIGGYPCGGVGEPCVPPANLPYFRPNAGATRGQLTKIVSNAAGFTDTIPPTQYSFADVLPANTFWVFVERLLLNRPGVMGGYACGGPGEPCDGQNRPYFRPNNPLTRGQTSKIVANTFFPGCQTP